MRQSQTSLLNLRKKVASEATAEHAGVGVRIAFLASTRYRCAGVQFSRDFIRASPLGLVYTLT